MPTIAQKLCHDIVGPGIKLSGNVKGRSSGKSVNSSTRNNAKSTSSQRTGSLDRTKLSKFEPTITTSSNLRGHKSGVIILNRSIADAAVNTLVSGPLRCDNNCVTTLRKRNHQGICKCSENRKNRKVSAKEIQTVHKVNYSLSDKACFQSVESASCGTQILENKSSILKQVAINDNKSKTRLKIKDFPKTGNDSAQNFDNYTYKLQDRKRSQFSYPTSPKPSLRYISAKRWALTNFPTRGPDF